MPLPCIDVSRRAIAACAMAGLLAAGLTACGSSASSPSASGAAGSSSSTRYQARLKFVECMRSHGVNLPDPSAGGGFAGGAGGGTGGGGGGGGGGFRTLLSTPTGQAASKACASLRSGAFGFNITPAQRAQFEQDAVKFAECMRAHGVDIPDPSSNGAGGFGIFRTIAPSERNSPAFQTAFKACSSTLPGRGRFGGRGTGTNSVGGPAA